MVELKTKYTLFMVKMPQTCFDIRPKWVELIKGVSYDESRKPPVRGRGMVTCPLDSSDAPALRMWWRSAVRQTHGGLAMKKLYNAGIDYHKQN